MKYGAACGNEVTAKWFAHLPMSPEVTGFF